MNSQQSLSESLIFPAFFAVCCGSAVWSFWLFIISVIVFIFVTAAAVRADRPRRAKPPRSREALGKLMLGWGFVMAIFGVLVKISILDSSFVLISGIVLGVWGIVLRLMPSEESEGIRSGIEQRQKLQAERDRCAGPFVPNKLEIKRRARFGY